MNIVAKCGKMLVKLGLVKGVPCSTNEDLIKITKGFITGRSIKLVDIESESLKLMNEFKDDMKKLKSKKKKIEEVKPIVKTKDVEIDELEEEKPKKKKRKKKKKEEIEE